MPDRKIKRALISVYDKMGIVEFSRALVDEFGVEIVSTGGTASLLKENAVPVTLVEDVTGSAEMMDGRVKTLHPKVHAAILADRDNPEHLRQLAERMIEPIDMVVVNLYPFDKTVADPDCTFEQAIEMIDIGGPCLLRAAAKNHRHVLVVHDPTTYAATLECLRDPSSARGHYEELCLRHAAGAFEMTMRYDARVVTWLGGQERLRGWPRLEVIAATTFSRLRYGENPHQEAELLQHSDDLRAIDLTVAGARWRSEKEISFNNYADANASLDLCEELTRGAAGRPCCVFVKHMNACGAALDDDPIAAYRRAYLGDPNAAMGGILAVNFEVTAAFAEAVMDSLKRWGKDAGAGAFFVEVWVAPSFEEDAVEVIRSRKKWGPNVRLLEVGTVGAEPRPGETDFKKIAGGILRQTRDTVGLDEAQWKVVTRRSPTASEMADLRLAWLICKHTKSNAITVCRDNMLIGAGAGQMSRVMSARIATWLAKENGHGDKLPGSVAASDAFFPFPDGPNILMDAGVAAIIQPGGSKRDEETIRACDDRGTALILTGTRHFRH